MTPEMVELEFAHIAIDRKLKGGNSEQYEDTDYDAYDKETEEHDSRLSDDGELPIYVPPIVKITEGDPEWEDVEVDD